MHRARQWLHRRANHRTATALTAGWGVAEALWLPVMPDVAVGVLALSAPTRWARLAGAAIVGSLAGGTVAHRLGATGRQPPLLLVTPRMIAAVDRWLAAHGARGVLHQPLSGVPFKVFAFRAARADVPAPALLAWAGIGRGARLLIVARLFGTIGAALARRPPTPHVAATTTTIIGFGVGLRSVVRRWS